MRRVVALPFRGVQHAVRWLASADSALFAGWAMVTAGCGLVSLAAGLVVGGLLLIGGSLFVARGSE